jgi:hypothetical protein
MYKTTYKVLKIQDGTSGLSIRGGTRYFNPPKMVFGTS